MSNFYKLIQGDCLKVLPQIESESIDLIVTDPPWNISQEGVKIRRDEMQFGTYRREKSINFDFGDWDKFGSEKEYFDFTESWFSECSRIMKKKSWIYIFFDKQKTGYFDLILARKYGIMSKVIFVWEKTNPTPQFRKANWLSVAEFIWVGSKGKSIIKNFGRWRDMKPIIRYPNSSIYGETKHTTEKPLKVLEKFIRTCSNEGETILDPFLGSGSTMKTCQNLQRNCIGIEISPEYCEMIKKRCFGKQFLDHQVEYKFEASE